MREVLSELELLRRRSRRLLLLQRVALVTAWILGVASALVLADYALRLPSAIRAVLLAGGIVAGVWAIRRLVLTAWRFHPTLTQLALRVERVLPALTGRLASSVEFSLAGIDQTNPLASRSVRDAEQRLAGDSVGRILAPQRALRDVVILGAVVALVALAVGAQPALAGTGLKRLLLPYGAAQWPARTAVASLMDEVMRHENVHPRGQVLALRARNLTDGAAADRVDVHFRFSRDGVFEPWEKAVLTHQGGGIHERLVDTNAEEIELFFATEDARTKSETIALVPPPAVVRATLAVTPPSYASEFVTPMQVELGPGYDSRAATENASLAGSEAVLTLELNKPLRTDDPQAWISATFGRLGTEPRASLPTLDTGDASGAASTRWRLAWRLFEPEELSVALTDAYGLSNTESIVYEIDVVEDLVPVATITQPQTDEAVLPRAIVPLVGEAKDDVAVARLGLRARVKREGSGEVVDLDFAPQASEVQATAEIAADLDLATSDLVEGDVVLVTAVADDVFDLDGERHATVTSPVRRLRIMSELDFIAQVRRQLSSVRQNAIRGEALQAELQDDVIDHGVQPGLKRAQAEVGDRVATQRERIDELRKQMKQNRLEDAALTELLQQSRDLLDYAGRAAGQAVDAIEQQTQRSPATEAGGAGEDAAGERREADETPEDEKDLAGVVDAQQNVRDELADLIELLDRDEDTWLVQRQLEGLLEQQRELQEQTSALAPGTIGQSREDLTPEQLSELDRIVQKQRELPDQARRLIDEMRRRAQALDDVDPRSASGMRSAADTGESREVDREMETAAERASQNQLQSAAAAQQAAQQSLERMLEDLEETRQAQAEELLRQLASLIESIDRLITVQENELIALAAAEQRESYVGRDRALIRLTQNTQSVAAEARAAGASARRIARSLDRAADAQGAAVMALRSDPIDPAAAREAEERSLAMLKEAKKFAEELEEETEQDQLNEQREKLIESYRKFAEMQAGIRVETLELAGHEELSRRELVEARRLGSAQQELRAGLTDLESQTAEIVDSTVFKYVHRLIDGWCGAISDALWEGTVDIDVTDRQQMVADSIARQIEALEEGTAPPDPFVDDQDQAGGGGGGAAPPTALIPPVAEVKRLHGLQEQIYHQTTSVDGRTDLSPAQRRQRVRELGTMQRELIELGEELVESLQPGPAPIAPAPQEPPGEAPADTPEEAAGEDDA